MFFLVLFLFVAAPALAQNPDGPPSLTYGMSGSQTKTEFVYERLDGTSGRIEYDHFEGYSLTPMLEFRAAVNEKTTVLLGFAYHIAWGEDSELGIVTGPSGLSQARFSQSTRIPTFSFAVRTYFFR